MAGATDLATPAAEKLIDALGAGDILLIVFGAMGGGLAAMWYIQKDRRSAPSTGGRSASEFVDKIESAMEKAADTKQLQSDVDEMKGTLWRVHELLIKISTILEGHK